MRFSIKSIAYVILLFILLCLLFIGGKEGYAYLTRSEASAKLSATELFHCISKQQGYREVDFDGPSRVQDRENVYAFVWTLRGAQNSTISIVVSYFPYDIDYSVSEALPFGRIRPTPRCR